MHRTRRSDPRRAKVRDMGRSVLPSTARKGAREEIRQAHVDARQRQTEILRELMEAPCVCDDPEAVDCPLCDADLAFKNPQRRIKYAVRDRRGADKVAPLIRWADAQIPEGTYPDEAYATMKAMLPAGIIGDHAMTHLDGVLPDRDIYHGLWSGARIVVENEDGELEVVWSDDYSPYLGGWKFHHAERRRFWAETRGARARHFAEWVIAEGRLGEFNKLDAVGHKPYPSDHLFGPSVRTSRALMGAHDIDDWAKGVALSDRWVDWAKGYGWVDPSV